jgi:hypothetical protein
MENTATNNMSRIFSPAEHREFLKYVFNTAKYQILIVSPIPSGSTLNINDLCVLVREATGRSISVTICFDDLSKEANGEPNPLVVGFVADLTDCGATVKIANGIENNTIARTIARDYNLIAEGSLNWLTAANTAVEICQGEEGTLVVEGEPAGAIIIKKQRTMERMAKETELQPQLLEQRNQEAWRNRKLLYLWVVAFLVAVVFLVYRFIDAGGGIGLGIILGLFTPVVLISDAFGFRNKKIYAPDLYTCTDSADNVMTDPVYASMPGNIYHRK